MPCKFSVHKCITLCKLMQHAATMHVYTTCTYHCTFCTLVSSHRTVSICLAAKTRLCLPYGYLGCGYPASRTQSLHDYAARLLQLQIQHIGEAEIYKWFYPAIISKVKLQPRHGGIELYGTVRLCKRGFGGRFVCLGVVCPLVYSVKSAREGFMYWCSLSHGILSSGPQYIMYATMYKSYSL